jgi:hypothetical protein
MRKAVFTLAVLVFALCAQAMTLFPPYPEPFTPVCTPTVMQNPAYAKTECTLLGTTYSAGGNIPIKFVAPVAKGKYPLVIHRHGYTRYPITCQNDDGVILASAGVIVMEPCAVYWPDQLQFSNFPSQPMSGSNPPLMNWGGPWKGANPEGMAAGEAYETAYSLFSIDAGAGVTIEGTSEGGTFGVLQSMIAPYLLQSQIAIVDATSPQTNLDFYYKDPAVRMAWGNFDISQLNFETVAASGKLDNIYYRIRGGTNDTLGLIDLDFFRTCDRFRISCFGTWDLGGHNADGEAGVNLPRGTYNEGQPPIRLDQPLPVFTQSTSNQWGPRGHYNLGLAARNTRTSDGNMLGELRYKRCTNLGADIPDQPDSATFDFTLRRIKATVGQVFTYTIGAQSGVVTVEKTNEITIPGITLASSNYYTTLTMTKQ